MLARLVFATALLAAVSAADIPISVGGEGLLAFTPPNVTANAGDNLIFTFQDKNHSVWQSSFANPCTNLPGGFTNPYFPVPVNGTLPTLTIPVKDTDPIWFYCPQIVPTFHCEIGMVGVVNAPPNSTFEQFQLSALAIGANNGTQITVSYAAPTPSVTVNPNDNSDYTGNGGVALEVGKLLLGISVIVALAF